MVYIRNRIYHMKKKMEKERATENVALPSKEDIEAVSRYKKAQEELLDILKYRILSLEEYKEIYEKYNLGKVISKVSGWTGLCKNCSKPLRPESFDLNKLKTLDYGKIDPALLERLQEQEKLHKIVQMEPRILRKTLKIERTERSSCLEIEPEQKCYILNKRCRDVKHKGRLCRNLGKQLREEYLQAGIISPEREIKYEPDPINIRRRFLQDYLFPTGVRENKEYCSVKCKRMAQNKRAYPASILKSSS